jgi:alkanesulfonate monooxygenase SsuD/methylene tetrahydromethanopterin reductase-like flavin-dependent oxidoreductase (luciferase family)
MQIGYKLSTESFGPSEIVAQARLAEEAGFDFVELSDHYHPWLELCIPWTAQVEAACRRRITRSGHLNPAAQRTRPRNPR